MLVEELLCWGDIIEFVDEICCDSVGGCGLKFVVVGLRLRFVFCWFWILFKLLYVCWLFMILLSFLFIELMLLLLLGVVFIEEFFGVKFRE